MSRIFNRPMFKRGGSAGQGITSGLDRPGYAVGLDVNQIQKDKEALLGMYGEPPRGYNTNDFLIDWGLKMASATPQGNVISTGAAAAREPFGKLTKGKADTEMAEYLSGVKATDTAFGAAKALKIAEMDAAARENLKKLPLSRQIKEIEETILKTAQLGSFSAENSGGVSAGRAFVLNEYEKGNRDVGVIENYTKIGTGKDKVWGFEETQLDANKVWYVPKKGEERWVVFRDDNNDGKADGNPITVDSVEKGLEVLRKGIEPVDLGYQGTEDIEAIESDTTIDIPEKKQPVTQGEFIVSHTEKMKNLAKSKEYPYKKWWLPNDEQENKLAANTLNMQ